MDRTTGGRTLQITARGPTQRAHASGTPYGMVPHLRDGLIARLEVYADGADALAASGLA